MDPGTAITLVTGAVAAVQWVLKQISDAIDEAAVIGRDLPLVEAAVKTVKNEVGK